MSDWSQALSSGPNKSRTVALEPLRAKAVLRRGERESERGLAGDCTLRPALLDPAGLMRLGAAREILQEAPVPPASADTALTRPQLFARRTGHERSTPTSWVVRHKFVSNRGGFGRAGQEGEPARRANRRRQATAPHPAISPRRAISLDWRCDARHSASAKRLTVQTTGAHSLCSYRSLAPSCSRSTHLSLPSFRLSSTRIPQDGLLPFPTALAHPFRRSVHVFI